MRSACLAKAVLAVTLLVGARAQAEHERVAIGMFVAYAQSQERTFPTELRDSLIGGLKAGGFEVASELEMASAIAQRPGLQKCSTPACLHSLAELLGVKLMVKARVEQAGHNFIIGIELTDPIGGRPLGRVDDRCEVCTTAEVIEAVSNAARLLANNRAAFVAAEPVVVAPAVAAPPAAVEPPRRNRWKLWLGIGLGAAAVVGIVIGVTVAETNRGTDFWSSAQNGCHTPSCTVVSFHK
jgi:hypothetical protein